MTETEEEDLDEDIDDFFGGKYDAASPVSSLRLIKVLKIDWK